MNYAAISKWLLIIITAGLFSTQGYAITDAEKQAISDRIKPVGQVCVEDGTGCSEAPAATPATTSVVSSSKKSGEEIYNSTCAGCHGTGAAGAPIFGNKDAWSKRIAAGKETLYDHALKGFNAMPAKGMCSSCSDDEIKAAVDHIISKSK